MMTTATDTTAPEKNKAPRGQGKKENDEQLAQRILKNLKRARDQRADWRRVAREDFDFFAGVQWNEEDQQKLAEEGRAAPVFNKIVRIVNAVAGVEVQNRQEARFLPRNVGSDQQQQPQQPPQNPTQMAQMPPMMQPNQQPPLQPAQPQLNDSGYSDILNAAAKWVRDQNDSEDEESEAFQDCLICGEGWTETRMDYDFDPDGMVVKDRLDPLQMLIDPDSKKRNYSDSKFRAYVKDMTPEEVEEMFPDLDFIPVQGAFWNDGNGMVHDADEAYKYQNDQGDNIVETGKIAVAQYQEFIKRPFYVVLTRDGNIVKFEQDKYEKAKSFINQQSIKVVKMMKNYYRQVFLVGDQVALKEDLGCSDFTLNCITGFPDRNRKYWFGLVSIMKDPQRWANKWLSQIQHIVNTNAKGGIMVETGAVKSMRKLEDDWATSDSVIELNPGGLGKIQPKPSSTYPEGVDRLLNYAINAINDIPGVSLEMIGMASRDQPIGLELSRKQSGITVLATFFDSLRRYRKVDARVLAYYIREYISDGRLIRIVGQDGAKYVPLVKDQMAFEYDIVVDDAPTSPNVKERTFAMIIQLIPIALQAGIPIPPEILDYAPLPDSLIQAWKALLSQGQQQDPLQEEMKQIALLMQKLEALKKQAEIDKLGSETVENYAQAEKDKAVGQEQAALAVERMGGNNKDFELKANVADREQARKDLQLLLNQQRKNLEVEIATQLKLAKHMNTISPTQIQ